MDNFVIEKQSLKFTVEVNVSEKGVALNLVRYISVNKNECMSSNAQLAKYDALHVHDDYVNCHDLMKGVMEEIRKSVPRGMAVNSRIILKRSQSFGQS